MLARPSLASASLERMSSRSFKLARLKAYARERMKAEIKEGPRGTQARLARVLDISSAHVANIYNKDSGPGEDVLEKLATYWKMTRDQMMAAALGEIPAPPSSDSQIKGSGVHPVVARAAKAGGHPDAAAVVASLMVRNLDTSDLREDVASELLGRAAMALDDGERLAASRMHIDSDWRTLKPLRRRKRPA